MDKPIQMPRISKRRITNEVSTLGGELGLPNAGNSFKQGALVVLDTGALRVIATAEVLVCGSCPDASHTANVVSVPDALKADRHWPFDLNGAQLLINVAHANGTDIHVGAAGSAKQLSDVAVGTSYGVVVPTTGTYAGIPCLDPTNTTQLMFKVIDKPLEIDPLSKQTAAIYNAQVLVEILPACIQQLG